jgi:CMP-N-acetylneuraminic acid synthetase
MLNGKTFLAVIPARGGSKRLPRKNILDMAGKPLIKWTIDSATKSKYIDKVVVTSDDAGLIRLSENCGAETIKRPDSLATDIAKTIDVVKHVIENEYLCYDYVILLQPTSPLRGTEHIDDAIELLLQKDADAVVSVCEMEHSPLWSGTLPESGSMECFIPQEIQNKRSQDLPEYYRLNGAIYVCHTVKLLEENSFFLSSNIYSYIMDRKSSVDIDDYVDFKLAELFLKKESKL